MALINSQTFAGNEEGEPMPVYPSKERVERDGKLLYAEGAPIAEDDVETLTAQGYIGAPAKARKAGTDKARKPPANK